MFIGIIIGLLIGASTGAVIMAMVITGKLGETPEERPPTIKDFTERLKTECYAEFDELIPSIISDKIDKILEEFEQTKHKKY
jgi:gas vesicle protein